MPSQADEESGFDPSRLDAWSPVLGLLDALSGALTADEVARIILETGVAALHADAGNVALVTDDGQAVRIIRMVGHDPARAAEWSVPLTTNAPIPLSIRTRDIVSYCSSDERRERFGEPATPFEAGITVPLIVNERALGTWGLSFRERRTFGLNERALLWAIGAQTAQALERARLLESERRARAEASAAEARAAAILDSIGDAFVSIDGDYRFTFVNRQAARLLGRDPEDLLGHTVWEVIPQHPDAPFRRALERAVNQHAACTLEEYSTDTRRWLEVRAYPSGASTSLIFRDVTDERRAKEDIAFLARAADALGASMEPEDTLRALARLCVPSLADACAVYMLDKDGSARMTAAAFTSPEQRHRARYLQPGPETDPSATILRVARVRQPELVTEVTDEHLRQATSDPALLGFLRGLAPRSAMVVPLATPSTTLGAIALLTTADSQRGYSERDLELTMELARRAATAVDNARLYRQAVDANAAKANFLAVMSHELRTPLTAIIGYAELLADGIAGPITEMQKDQLTRVKASSVHLLTLIEEILAFARIEAGHETMRIERIDVRDVLRGVDAVIEPLAERKRLRRVLDLPAHPLWCETDAGKLRQIILNLAANAVKFTDAGEIRLEAVGSDSEVVLRVADTGVGISADNIDRVFDPFWQVEQGTTRKVGGTGLGLSVARRLTALLRGELSVTSVVGEGSTFTLRLPLASPGS